MGADIKVSKEHSTTLAKARQAVDEVASKLGEKFGLDYRWSGDTLEFSRSGCRGEIAVGEGLIEVNAKLGLFLLALRGPIETEIRNYLDKAFGSDDPIA